MKQTFLFFFLVALALVAAAPVPDKDEPIKILKSVYDLDPAGSYNFGFETENNIQREETGELKTVKSEEGKDEQVVVVRGSFSYVEADGTPITVNYVADETGFHPVGAHLPTAPGAK